MDKFEILYNLLNLKKDNITTVDEEKKYLVVEKLLKDKGCFFKINIETAIGILDFLGVNENEILNFYSELISPSNYKKNIPSERVLFDDKIK